MATAHRACQCWSLSHRLLELTDGDTFSVDGTEVAVLKQVHHEVLCGLQVVDQPGRTPGSAGAQHPVIWHCYATRNANMVYNAGPHATRHSTTTARALA